MNLFPVDEEIEEIKIEDLLPSSTDRGKVITTGAGRQEGDKNRSELEKEIIGIDSVLIGPQKAAQIHGVDEANASYYKDGKFVDSETRTNILSVRHSIADKAIAKLMDSLNLFDPNALDKQTDIVKSAAMLAGIVEKITPQNSKNNGNSVVLNIYSPRQSPIDKYEVIDV